MSHRIDDGFSTIIGFSLNGAVKFYEKEVTPPGIDGGGANQTTTMRNIYWRTNAPKKLVTLTEADATCAYDPTVFSQILAMVNVNQYITVTYPDLTTVGFWGWINEFKPNQIKEGEQPTANVKIIPSNFNASLVETAPTVVAGP